MWLLVGLLSLVWYLPASWRWAVSTRLGRWYVSRGSKQRKYAALNLALCYPDLTEQARQQRLEEHFIVYFWSLLELPGLWLATRKHIEKHTQIDGHEHIANSVAQGRQVILLTCHAVTLEYAAQALVLNQPMLGFYNQFKHPVFDWLMYYSRTRHGGGLIERHQGMRSVVKRVRQGEILYYFADEDLGLENAVFAPFFGNEKATLTALTRLSSLCQADVIPCYSYYDPHQQQYRVVLEPPLSPFSGDDLDADARQINRAIEDLIAHAPAQYMWRQRLFKTPLPGEQSIYKKHFGVYG